MKGKKNKRPTDNRAMVQTVSRRSCRAEYEVWSQASKCGICGVVSGNGTGISPSTSAFSLHHCTNISYQFTHLSQTFYIPIFMFAPCINSIKTLFVVPTDAHNYKIIGILKQLKFRQLLRHVSVHLGTIIRELFHPCSFS